MSQVVVYSSDWCPYCMRAKALLDKKGVAFEEIKVVGKPQVRADMARHGIPASKLHHERFEFR